ncbi:hypothetical protein E2C01_006228 [Portunus trituberculatus]|uniref:Uncharacterized protein n=1 Tax=Portunus trituberculatus TaxID=210409 RepID=A0A5B7CVS1_PORTR|nr:hypothetical protein [Portunus trituberculatus]
MRLGGDTGSNMGTTTNKIACATNGWKLNSASNTLQNRIGIVARGSPAPRASTPTSTSNSESSCGLFFTGSGCKPHPNQLGQPWAVRLVSLGVKTLASQPKAVTRSPRSLIVGKVSLGCDDLEPGLEWRESLVELRSNASPRCVRGRWEEEGGTVGDAMRGNLDFTTGSRKFGQTLRKQDKSVYRSSDNLIS